MKISKLMTLICKNQEIMLMSPNKFKNVLAVTTTLALASCLVPEVAQAGLLRGNGGATNTSTFDISIEDSIPGNNGYFSGAIQNFNLSPGSFFTNSQICGAPTCPLGNLTVSKLSTDSTGNIAGLDFGLEGLNTIFSNSNINFSLGDTRYDVTFVATTPAPELIWFIDSKADSSINNLSDLSKYDSINGIFPSDVAVFDDGSVNNGGRFSFSVKPVPEPSTTAGVVGVGVLGAASLLKRNKNRKKLVHK